MVDNLNEKLKTMLSEKRYHHSLGVQKTAVDLARKYNADDKKASIAGIVHDCAKGFSDEKLITIYKNCGMKMNAVYEKQPQLLHGPVGAFVARKEFLITDGEILHAIEYHTTGCEDMSMLDKIIYIADYIEPGRNFPGVDELRSAAFVDINRSLIMAFDSTIRYVLERQQLLDLETIRARNFILCKTDA